MNDRTLRRRAAARAVARTSCALLAAAIAGAPATLRADAPVRSFERVAERFVAESERRDPLFADGIGVHAYDDELDDYSAAGHARRIAWLDAWSARLDAVQSTTTDPDDAADIRELADSIELERYEDRTLAPVHNDPTLYTGVIGEAIYALTGRHYATPERRFAHIATRLALIPGVVRAAETMLRRPTRASTLQAIDDNAGNLALYLGLTDATKDASPDTRTAIAAKLPAAIASIRSLSKYLQSELLPRSDRNPRVGAAIFDRELSLSAGTNESRANLVAEATAEFARTRAEMLRLAIPFDRKFFPSRTADESRPNATDIVVRRVLDRLADAHPARDAVFTSAKGDVARVEAFLAANPVVRLPQPPSLHVVPTPAFMAGFSGASMEPPGPFSPLGEAYFYIDEIPKTWSASRVRSYLRDFNDDELQMLAIHEAVPGHYVQFRYGAAVPSIVRRVFSNGSYVEGWAVYGEGMILDAGFRADDPALRLFQLKWRLREYANVLIDAGFHTGDLTLARCEDLLERQAFQEHSQALTKWHRLQLSHDQLTTYVVGLISIRKAEARERRRLGSAFTVAAFNARLLALGAVEPRFIAPLLERR